MKILDALGNEITKDNTMYWKDKDLFVQVAQIVEGDDKVPGGLFILVALPLHVDNKVKGDNPIQLTSFLRTVDPRSQQVLTAIAGGKK